MVFGEPRVGAPDPEAPSLPGLPVFETYQSTIGLDGILQRVLDQVGVVPALGSPVTKVVTTPTGVEVHTAWRTIQADHVVLACDPNTAADILDAGGSAPPALLTALRQMEYVPLPISMQKGSACYMPSDSALWEPVNTIVDGNRATFSCWFGPLRAKYGAGQQIPVFKSWASPGLDPAACPHEFLAHQHRILQPTTAFMAAREDVMAWQGHGGVWFAGGWTNWFDSQEAALDSATSVADRLPGAPRRRTGPARMRRLDPATKEHHLQLWLERMARQAPAPQGERLARAIDEVGSRI
jgi:predicted NAD/FAD-binding protein